MGVTWIHTKFKGVRYYESDTRRNGIRKDRYYVIRHMGYIKDKETGKAKWGQKDEKLGWESDGWTAEKAALKLANIRNAKTTGSGEQSLEEMRENEKARRKAAEDEIKRIKRESVTFGQYFINTYFPAAEKEKKESSYSKEMVHFNLWINPVIGKKQLKDIKPTDIKQIRENLLDAGRSSRTVQYVLATVRHALNEARNNELISGDNPARGVKAPKVDNKRQRFLTSHEESLLLERLKDRSLKVYRITLLSLRTGMRASEIFNLKWKDIDTAEGKILILDPKGKSNRYAFMVDGIKGIFDEMDKGRPGEYVFKSTKGKMLKEVSDTFARTVEDLKLNEDIADPRQKVVFHSCRHTFASRLVENGTDLYVVKNLLGHSSIVLTERYSHIGEGAMQSAMKTLNNRLNRTGKVIDIRTRKAG